MPTSIMTLATIYHLWLNEIVNRIRFNHQIAINIDFIYCFILIGCHMERKWAIFLPCFFFLFYFCYVPRAFTLWFVSSFFYNDMLQRKQLNCKQCCHSLVKSYRAWGWSSKCILPVLYLSFKRISALVARIIPRTLLQNTTNSLNLFRFLFTMRWIVLCFLHSCSCNLIWLCCDLEVSM